MRVLGLLGGMSWESTVPYYRIINETVRRELGGLHSAELVLHSFDFAPIERWQNEGAWDELGRVLADAAERLTAAGATGIVLCTNTMHCVVPAIEARVDTPVLHIADATAHRVNGAGFETVGLLGTRHTMEQTFYRHRLESRHGLRVLTPPEDDRELINRVIYDELCKGEIHDSSCGEFLRIIEALRSDGAEGVILGCTEIGLLVPEEIAPIPAFNTTAIHAEAAALWALGRFEFET